jgi:hypothetical protein
MEFNETDLCKMLHTDFREGLSLLKKSPPDLTRGFGPKQPGSKRPKTALSAPEQGSEEGAKAFFNRLTPTRQLGKWQKRKDWGGLAPA